MLNLQAKHFGISAKNKIQNIQFENQKQKNLHLEKAQRIQLNKSLDYGTFQVKPRKHLSEVSHLMEQVHQMTNNHPVGLKATNHLR